MPRSRHQRRRRESRGSQTIYPDPLVLAAFGDPSTHLAMVAGTHAVSGCSGAGDGGIRPVDLSGRTPRDRRRNSGTGNRILGNTLLAHELETGVLVKAVDFTAPGTGYYLVYLSDHPRKAQIEDLASWARSVR